jgi:hypothetical protein
VALYDPREFPEAETVSPDFTLEDVLAWARTKPADEPYWYGSCNNCAIAQFLRETGRAERPEVELDGAWIDVVGDGNGYAPVAVNTAATAFGSAATFGRFAARIEAELAR